MKKLMGAKTLVLLLVVSAGAAAGEASSWKCSAAGLANAQYDGSDYAYVQLQGYSRGSQYKVTLNEQKTEATGTTGNGTPFTCVRVK